MEHYKTWDSRIPETEMLPDAFAARLLPRIAMQLDADGTPSIDLGWRDLQFEADDAEFLQKVLAAADGSLDVKELTPRCGRSFEQTNAALQTLFQEGIVDCAVLIELPAVSVYWHVVNRARRLVDRMRNGSVIPALLAGRGHRRLLLGVLLERHHYVCHAAAHIAEAVRSAPSERVRMLLSEYLAEEYSHGLWVRSGLERAIPREMIDAAVPLSATRAVTNFLVSVARTDLLAYGACVGVIEHPLVEEVLEDQTAFWDNLQALNLVPAEVLQPFRKHELTDIEQQHGGLAAEIFAEAETVTPVQLRNIERSVAEFVYLLADWDRAIWQFYGAKEGAATFAPALD